MKNPLWSYLFSPPREKRTLLELLKLLPMFEGLNQQELIQISRALHERKYHKGETVFKENEPGAGMYIIEKGEIAIIKELQGDNSITLAILKEKSFFGELALLDEIPRSASAAVEKDAILLGFCKPDLEKLIERNPRLGAKILSNLARLICRRLLQANANMEQMQNDLNEFKRVRDHGG
ncbi:MAG: cyclic nucleotide-binding domain-containing protein [Chitinivibrionales bacterium]|nr:cyclic nucleotide-binding domain-containing protein [Chitinivibrionales bacterium]